MSQDPILLVDDDPELLSVLNRAFESRCHETLLASNEEEANRWMESRADCRRALIDLRIPSTSGSEPTAEIGTRLIQQFLSRGGRYAAGLSGEKRLEQLAREAGATDFFLKGDFEDQEIVDALLRPLHDHVTEFEESEREYHWFLTESPDRMTYQGQVVVVKKRRVLGSGATHLAAWEDAMQRHGARVKRDDVQFIVVPPEAVAHAPS